MNTNTTFVNKQIARLPIKYAVISVSTFLQKNLKPSRHASLDNIDKQFLEFIEMPRNKGNL